uniref:Ubiquitin fusion degradation protein 1 n=1 Tax=Anthurium amnicola TaxID=1678845 RepID=A0A1D1ZJX7_9ARAE
MDFELRKAREKLEREQRERKERAKQRLERERRAKAEAAGRREAVETAQRARRLDAARAQQLVEQQIEESLLIGNGLIFCRTLEAACCSGFGDKIKLPPSCFTELSDQGALDKGPMYFRLSKVDGSTSPERTTHSGVLEFTANEGSVELPPHVWSNLFCDGEVDAPLVEVHYVSLPKGTYAKLQPEEMGFSDIPYHKAVLETSLRRHATLSQGDVITVNHGELSYKLRVLELKPSSNVSVIETDVEVDIVEPETSSDSKRQHTLIPLVLGKVECGLVEEGNFNYYKFLIDDSISERVASGDLNLEINLEADASEGDTNIYVSRYPVIFPTQHRHEWSSHDMGSKVLILVPKDPNAVAGTYSVGVFGYKGQTKYHISVALKEKTRRRVGEQSAGPSHIDTDLVECHNCRHQISSQSIMIHEAFCFRHNVVCQHDGCGVVLRKEEAGKHVHCYKCGLAFQQEEMEKHLVVFHQPVQCPCGAVLEKEAMVQHQSAICPLRLITCRFCGDMVQAGNSATDARDRLRGLTEHESVCGSRTAPCDSCGRSVMLKDMDIHLIAVHQKS